MRWWCAAVIVFGLVLAGAVVAPVDAPALMLLTAFGGHSPAVTSELRFAVGLMGAVTLGWGATLLAVANRTSRIEPDVARGLWRGIGGAVAAWFVIDSAISVATGFWPNAVSNAVLMGWFWVARPR